MAASKPRRKARPKTRPASELYAQWGALPLRERVARAAMWLQREVGANLSVKSEKVEPKALPAAGCFFTPYDEWSEVVEVSLYVAGKSYYGRSLASVVWQHLKGAGFDSISPRGVAYRRIARRRDDLPNQ